MNYSKIVTWLGCLALALIAPLALALDAVGITGIEVNNVSAEKQVVKINFNGEAPNPASFSINTPPRIAFDFANTTNQAGKNSVTVNGNVLRLINIAEAPGRTRVVLNLQKRATYQTKAEGNAVFITVDSAGVDTVTAQTTHFSDAKPTEKPQGIQNIDFRRGDNGEGKIVVDLSSPNVGIDIRQQGKSLVVEFAKAALPKKLERSLDVTDFGTLVQKIDAYSQPDSAKLVIEPKGNWEYSAYQTENRFTIEVREAVDESKKLTSQKTYKGEKLSLNFQNVEIRTVLQVLAEFTGMNIITSDSVNGSLTLRLKDVPWDQAMDIILQAKGLDQRKVGNVVWIAPRDELAAKEKQELESKKQIDELVPTRQEMFHLKYQKAEDFGKLLQDDKNKLLSKRGSAVPDSITNTLIINDIPTKLEEVHDLIAKLDVPSRQVMIEARIVEATEGYSRELGARLGLVNKGGTNTYSGTLADASNGTSAGVYPQNLAVNLPAASINGFAAGSFAGLFGSVLGNTISLELSALESENSGKIVSSPRLITADRVEATIEDGVEIPYSQTAPNGATTVSFKKATLSLKVTPQITPDGNVIMDLNVNKDSQGVNTTAGPAIDTKQIHTKVLVENGGTVVIGGIYLQSIANETDQVPLLGDIPVLGNLFKHKSRTTSKRELLIFITPKIMPQGLAIQ
ncbi:MAG: type IV pilus secretin PilQ [Formivibrio sp.]|nr:type IV pilus secretin PilQ [Formivibrio sp.]